MPGVVRMVGRYEVVRQIGRGGMAVVHLARQVDLDRWVALKELGAFHASEPSLAQRFVRESRVAGSLSHPNIVTVHDFFEYERTPYIAMEYLSQGSLRPYMRGLALPQIVGLLEGVLAGLSHAEGRGVVHRDLKPENLMVTDDGRVKITDFGIAKATDHLQSATYSTAAGTAVGTPAYIAPEQALGEEVGPWTDLYSVGCIAYEAATGQLPFGDTATPAAMLLRHVNEPVVAPRLVRPELEASLSDWIEALLAKAPAARPAAATEAWERLEDIAIQVLGPRWRRDARLPTSVAGSSGAPLRPASFGTPEAEAARPGEEGGAASASAVEYTTHTPAGEPAGPDDVTEGLTTPPGRDAGATPPSFGTSDLELDIPVGPDTPASLPAAHAGARRGHAERSAGEAGHGAPPSPGSIGEARQSCGGRGASVRAGGRRPACGRPRAGRAVRGAPPAGFALPRSGPSSWWPASWPRSSSPGPATRPGLAARPRARPRLCRWCVRRWSRGRSPWGCRRAGPRRPRLGRLPYSGCAGPPARLRRTTRTARPWSDSPPGAPCGAPFWRTGWSAGSPAAGRRRRSASAWVRTGRRPTATTASRRAGRTAR